jgi:hypothetical protein
MQCIQGTSAKEITMKKNILVRLSGWSFILGAIVFLPGISAMMLYDTPYAVNWDSQVFIWTIFLSPILIAVGMMGLRMRYRIGGGFLLFGAVVGGIVTLIGTLGQMFAPVYSVSESYFGVWLGGAYILFFCLTLFGINALVEKPLPRWNALPLLSGLWFAVGPLIGPLLLFGIRRVSVEAYLVILIAGFLVMAIAQIILGYILQADAPQEMATA